MFYFPNDDSSNNIRGCLTRRTLKEDKATKYVFMKQTKFDNKIKIELFSNRRKVLNTVFLENEEDIPKMNIQKHLTNLIQG